MIDQTDPPQWRDGVPISPRFDDPYYSLENGLDETRYVFLSGNDLPARFATDLHIAELGFGTGLNLLVTWAAWEAIPERGTLRFTSFEAYPISNAARAQALAAFPSLAPQISRLPAKLPDGLTELAPGLELELILGDARTTLPQWAGRADAWFLDGFSPAKNPQLWEAPLLSAVAQHTAPGGTFATYTAAGHVRRALSEAGFVVERVPGFGRKRHMSRGQRPA